MILKLIKKKPKLTLFKQEIKQNKFQFIENDIKENQVKLMVSKTLQYMCVLDFSYS